MDDICRQLPITHYPLPITHYPLPITNMQCPNCGTTAVISDRFCEECGTPLAESTGGCIKCGAAVSAIDADGFCGECGFRSVAKERDHIETSCSNNLAGVSDRGLRHHTNEDHFACAIESNSYVMVVCDGVSSSQFPELASLAAAEAASKALTTMIVAGKIDLKQAVSAALCQVAAIPYTQGTESDPPSTTFVAAVVQADNATIAWLGDSRAYWLSQKGCRQLTQDDSWVNEVVTAGAMSETQALQSPHAHAITRWIGADAKDNAEPKIVNFAIPGAGYLLLCSDGLWNYAPDAAQIYELVKETEAEALTIARHLVEFARHAGGRDNITVALLSFN